MIELSVGADNLSQVQTIPFSFLNGRSTSGVPVPGADVLGAGDAPRLTSAAGGAGRGSGRVEEAAAVIAMRQYS